MLSTTCVLPKFERTLIQAAPTICSIFIGNFTAIQLRIGLSVERSLKFTVIFELLFAIMKTCTFFGNLTFNIYRSKVLMSTRKSEKMLFLKYF